VNHEGKTVIDAFFYNNTVYDTASGVSFANAPSGASLVAGNAIFSQNPLSGSVPAERDNVTGGVASAASHVVRPTKLLGQMDFYPIAGSPLHGSVVDLSAAGADVEHDRDFNGRVKDFSYRGAYQGEGQNPGWPLADGLKPLGGGAGGTAGTGGGPSTGGAGGGPATGGSGGAAGTSGASGSSSGAAGSGAAAGDVGATPGGAAEDGGCGCRLRPLRERSRAHPRWSAVFVLFLLGAIRRRGAGLKR